MARQDNICKFITQSGGGGLYTTNFVFETQAAGSPTFMPKDNVIYLVTGGKGLLCTEHSKKQLAAGNIFFTFQNVPFTIQNTDNLEYMYITFGGERCSELFRRFNISPTNCVAEGHEGLASFWQSALVKASEKNLDLISEAVLLYTLGEMAPPADSGDSQLLGSILKYVEDNFADSELNLAAVADALGYNGKYVSRIFKEKMGVTFSAYLTNKRISHAVFLIEQGVTAIKNVALLSGYKDAYYFSNVFKNTVGISPSEYVSKNS